MRERRIPAWMGIDGVSPWKRQPAQNCRQDTRNPPIYIALNSANIFSNTKPWVVLTASLIITFLTFTVWSRHPYLSAMVSTAVCTQGSVADEKVPLKLTFRGQRLSHHLERRGPREPLSWGPGSNTFQPKHLPVVLRPCVCDGRAGVLCKSRGTRGRRFLG